MSRPVIDKRYPFAPLAEAMGLSQHQAAIALGLSGSTQKDYRERGLTERVADRLAVKAGIDPYNVWPEMVDDLVASVERVCASDRCDNRFLPVRRDQVACSKRCGVRVRHLRRMHRYRTDPSVAAARKAESARYYAECREYVRERQRRARSAPQQMENHQ